MPVSDKQKMANSNVLSENIPNITEETRLLEEYEQLVIKHHKQQLVLSTMKNIDSNGMQSVDDSGKKNIDEALDFVRAFDYLKMDNAGTNVLGKSNDRNNYA